MRNFKDRFSVATRHNPFNVFAPIASGSSCLPPPPLVIGDLDAPFKFHYFGIPFAFGGVVGLPLLTLHLPKQ